MKAIVYTQYGPPEVLHVQEVNKPVPRNNEALIKVHATTVASAEMMARRGESAISRLLLGLRGPRKRFQILGMEIAGEIEAVGKAYRRFKVGDQIYGFTGFRLGAYAEYLCMPESGSLATKPSNLTYEEAAAVVDGATTALYFLRDKGQVQAGQRVLIIGASGCIGTFAVQLARYFGAEVEGVCSTANVELVKSLGASRVFDYTSEDFAQSGETYNIIFDTVGKSSFSHCHGSLKEHGRYLVTNGNMVMNYLRTWWTALRGGKRHMFGLSIEKTAALNFIRGPIETGHIRPVIDRRYLLAQIVEAHRYVDKGHKKGNVVVTVTQDHNPGGNS